MSGTDQIVRAITNDGSFRVIVARSTETVRGVLDVQKPASGTAERLGEIVTGAILVRETMAPDLRVQAIIKGTDGKGSLVADAHPGGLTRGLAIEPVGGGGVTLGEGALLQMVRTMPNGSLHQGIVEASGSKGLSGALMAYMQESEQVTSVLAVDCVFDDDGLKAAGGYCIQVLPEVDRSSMQGMLTRLESFAGLRASLKTSGGDPGALLEALLEGVEYTRVEETTIHFGCVCNEVRVVGALATIGKEDLEHLLDSEQEIELTCDYCQRGYQVPHAQLRALLQDS